MSDIFGVVYGITIKLEEDEIVQFKEEIKNKSYVKKDVLNNWIQTDNNYYPLYCGCDINLESRLRHIQKHIKVHTKFK